MVRKSRDDPEALAESGYLRTVAIEVLYDIVVYEYSPMKPVVWMGSSRDDLRAMPQRVRRDIGQALYTAQQGETDPAAKPLKGFGGARVMEIVERHRGDAYRAVYTVQFAEAIYVLHVFQKKSKRGIATPKPDLDLIKRRLAEAGRLYSEGHD